ncbi:hypothetical protein B0G57_114133 [Trinickia symbiotica]|nr:hypothetical protein B0G57_114133 [Trinickia symbiotica]
MRFLAELLKDYLLAYRITLKDYRALSPLTLSWLVCSWRW